MSVPLDYKDTVTLVTTTVNNYGDDIEVASAETVNALIVMNTGFAHADNQDAIVSDAVVYIDQNDSFVIDNYDRLEEMYCIIGKYGVPQARGWYKIASVTVSDDLLLTNSTDNIQLNLTKTDNIYDVS